MLAYLPFGENFVDLSFGYSYESPYKFNGKEKDEETGYNNYEARYYGSDEGIFLSVDPLADKYPSWTPYHYCHNNPIRFVDPTGMEADEWNVNISTGKVEWVSDKGGEETTHINLKDKNNNVYKFSLPTQELKDAAEKNETPDPGDMEGYYRADLKNAKGVENNVRAALTYMSYKMGLNTSTDPCNSGLPPEQGLPILAGTVGVATGGMGAALSGTAIGAAMGSTSVGLGISGIFTNSKGESGFQQLMSTPQGKTRMGNAESYLSIGLGGVGVIKPKGVYDIVGGTTGIICGSTYIYNQKK